MLFTFVGCSGVGKNTIIGDLLNAHPDRYVLLPTVSTRAMRPGESQGNPYQFVTVEKFKEMIADGTIYEFQWIHENLYGGSWELLKGKLKDNKILLKDIDVLGSNTLKEKFKGTLPVISIFMYVSDVEILLNRLRGRGETPDEIEKRRKRFDMEMDLACTGDYLINNIVREDTASLIDHIIAAEAAETAYSLAEGCTLPSAESVRARLREVKDGKALKCVEMAFNGKDIMILDGADRYAAAKKAGVFVQKSFVNAYTPEIRLSKDNECWLSSLEAQ